MIDGPTYIAEFSHKNRRYLTETPYGFMHYEVARAIFDGELEDVTAVWRVQRGKETIDVLPEVVAMVESLQHVAFNQGRQRREELLDWIDRNGGIALREPYEIDADDERSQMDREDRAFQDAEE